MQRLWHQAGAAQISSVSIALTRKGGRAGARKDATAATIWDIRDRLPTDVLREIAIEESRRRSPRRRSSASS